MAKARKRVSAESTIYILRDDRSLSPAEQSRFTLRPLNIAERQRIRDQAVWRVVMPDGAQRIESRMRQLAFGLALSHIESIENFPAGAPKPWPHDEDARASYLELLGDDYVFEIGDEILGRSKLGEVEAATLGNSSPLELTSDSGGPSPAAPAETA